MIRNFLEFSLMILLSIYFSFSFSLNKAHETLDQFYFRLDENSIDYLLIDELVLVFDYQNVGNLIEDVFQDYDVKLEKHSETSFSVYVEVNVFFLNKTVEEEYEIVRGNMNEKSN